MISYDRNPTGGFMFIENQIDANLFSIRNDHHLFAYNLISYLRNNF